MRRFFKGLFQGSPPPNEEVGEAERNLSALRLRLEQAVSGSPEEAMLLNRVADGELAAGNRDLALKVYGRSIDAHMALGQFDASTAICRKVLRLLPDVVRARCTLAWLSLGKGLLDVAREQLDLYVAAAIRADRREMAGQQLRLMAQYARDPGFREYLAGKLRELGDQAGAGALQAWSDSLPTPEEIGWDPVVFAALLTPDELKEAQAKGLDLKPMRATDDDFPYYFPPS